jgi:hypothetical protein
VKPHFDAVRTLSMGKWTRFGIAARPKTSWRWWSSKLGPVVIYGIPARSKFRLIEVSAKLELTDATLRPSRRSMGPFETFCLDVRGVSK